MKYMLSVRVDESATPSPDEGRAVAERVGKVNTELRATGTWVFGAGLLSSDSATVVRVDAGATTMTDGPFAETKEQVGGFWVIRCADLDQALGWAEKCAEACGNPIEVRPLDDGVEDETETPAWI